MNTEDENADSDENYTGATFSDFVYGDTEYTQSDTQSDTQYPNTQYPNTVENNNGNNFRAISTADADEDEMTRRLEMIEMDEMVANLGCQEEDLLFSTTAPIQAENMYRNNNYVDETPDELDDFQHEARDNAAINGITHGIIRKYIRKPIFNYPVYSPRLHDQMNDPISLFGSRQYSKWLRNFIFNGIIKQKNYYCEEDLTLGDLQIVFKRARQVFIGLKTHTSVRRQITWQDYLTYMEMINFLFDLLACACRNCFRVQEIGLFSIFDTDFLRLIQFPPPNIYKSWPVYQFYQGLLKGDYPRLEVFLVRCPYSISPSSLSKIIISSLVVLFYLYFTCPEYFLFCILIFTVGRLLLAPLFFLIFPVCLQLYFFHWTFTTRVILTLLFGSCCLCFTHAAYFACRILISTVCRMAFLLPFSSLVALRYLQVYTVVYSISILTRAPSDGHVCPSLSCPSLTQVKNRSSSSRRTRRTRRTRWTRRSRPRPVGTRPRRG